jgi:hypothetical protein
VAKGVRSVPWKVQARVTVHESGADSAYQLAVWLGWFDADFEVTEPPELVDELRRLASRYGRATARSGSW